MDSGKFWILNVVIFSMRNVVFPWPKQDEDKPNIEKKEQLLTLFRLLSQYRIGHWIKNSRVHQFHGTRAQMVIVFHWMEISRRFFFGREEKHIVIESTQSRTKESRLFSSLGQCVRWSTHETRRKKHGSEHAYKLLLWLRVAPMRLVKWWIIAIMNYEQNLVCEMFTRNCWANLKLI